MASEWVGPTATALVALAGLATNIVISVSVGHTQRALLAAGHELQAETARSEEKRKAYTRFISDIDSWNRALVPAGRRLREAQAGSGKTSLLRAWARPWGSDPSGRPPAGAARSEGCPAILASPPRRDPRGLRRTLPAGGAGADARPSMSGRWSTACSPNSP